MTNFMSNEMFILIILGTMIVTYIPRMLPLVLLSKTVLPKRVESFLDYIPIAILGAILFETLLIRDSVINIKLDNDYLLAGVLTIILARFVKRVDVIVVFGIITTLLLRLF